MYKNLLIFLLAVFFLTSCASLRPQSPEVTLETVRLAKFSLTEPHFDLILRVHNPNAQDFVLSKLTYQVDVAGKAFARGESRQRMILVAKGDTLVELPAIASVGNVFNTLLEGIAGGEFEYRVFGEAELEGWGQQLPFDRKKKIALRL